MTTHWLLVTKGGEERVASIWIETYGRETIDADGLKRGKQLCREDVEDVEIVGKDEEEGEEGESIGKTLGKGSIDEKREEERDNIDEKKGKAWLLNTICQLI